jgi:hypothetical protein
MDSRGLLNGLDGSLPRPWVDQYNSWRLSVTGFLQQSLVRRPRPRPIRTACTVAACFFFLVILLRSHREVRLFVEELGWKTIDNRSRKSTTGPSTLRITLSMRSPKTLQSFPRDSPSNIMIPSPIIYKRPIPLFISCSPQRGAPPTYAVP